MSNEEDTVEAVVCHLQDLHGNLPLMREVDVGEAGKCLLIRHEDGEFTALGHKCTHYGAPLARGALSNGTVRCPWHGACFNSKTGDIEDYPGLDSLQKYQVTVNKHNGEVKVKAKRKHLVDVKRNTCTDGCVDSIGKDQQVVIIGGGPASLVCAETLRKKGFNGKISIICKESHPPYDRAKLSKALDAEAETFYLRKIEYYETVNIDIHTGVEALSLDTDQKKVLLSKSVSGDADDSEKAIHYDKLFIATGGKPRTLHPKPGWDSDNIFILRTLDDANKIASTCKEKKVVLVGSSFIGMEIASYLAKKKECSCISVVCGRTSEVPFKSSLGAGVGELVMKMHRDKGIRFHTSAGISELHCDEETKNVTHVKLSDDTNIEADVIILGIGVDPATEFLKSSALKMNERGFIPVDCNMLTNLPDVYAGGDITMFPLGIKGGELTNIQHWQMAHTHGRIAANSIICSYTKQDQDCSSHVESVPFFWTVQFGLSFRYAGHGAKFDQVIIKGVDKQGKVISGDEALAAKKFAAFYVKDDCVVAVATLMADPVAARFAERAKIGKLKMEDIDAFLKGEKEPKSATKDGCRVA